MPDPTDHLAEGTSSAAQPPSQPSAETSRQDQRLLPQGVAAIVVLLAVVMWLLGAMFVAKWWMDL